MSDPAGIVMIKKVKARFSKKKKAGDLDEMVSGKRRRDHRRLDYRYAEDSPFFFIKGDGVWTGVTVATTTDSFDTNMEELQLVDKKTDMYRRLSTQFSTQYGMEEVKTHTITRYRPSDTAYWCQRYLQQCWDPSALFGSLIEDQVAPFLAETTPERREYLLVRLGDFKGKTTPDAISRLVGGAEAVADEMFEEDELQRWRIRAVQIQSILGDFGAEPMYRADLSWLIRRTLSGHFPVDEENSYLAVRKWRGSHFDLIADWSGKAIGDYVRSQGVDPDTHERAMTYTTTLTVSSTAIIQDYRFGESWAKRLRTMERPVDISWRATIMSSKAWQKQASKSIAEVKTEYEDRVESGKNNSQDFAEVHELSLATEATLENPAPVMAGQLRLVVSAPSPEELDNIVGKIRTEMASFDQSTVIERRTKIQGLLLEEQLPGDPTIKSPGRSGINTFTDGVDVETRYTDIEVLSFARLDSSPMVGDQVIIKNNKELGWIGPPIGYSLENGAATHFDPMSQVARNRGAGVLIIGATGSGKSSLGLMLFFWTTESGVQGIVFDPKNDFEAFALFIGFGAQVNMAGFDEEAAAGTLGTQDSQFQPVNRDWWDQTSVASLGSGRRGLLDPWAITRDEEEEDNGYMAGESLARDLLEIIIPDKETRSFLNNAFMNMRDAHIGPDARPTARPTLSELSGHLAQDIEQVMTWQQDAGITASDKIALQNRISALRSAADELDRARMRPGGQLLFADPDARVKPFTIGRTRRTIITLFGLTMPGENDDDINTMGADKRDGVAAAFVVLKSVHGYALGAKRARQRISPNPLAGGRRQRPPLIVFLDELKTFTLISAGKQLLSELLRKGRSLNVVVVPITQQAKDTRGIEKDTGDDGEEVNQFGTRFVFYQKGGSESRDALKMLRNTDGLGEDEINKMASMVHEGYITTGECAMADSEGRVSLIVVDKIFTELTAASETNSQVKASVQNFDPSADGRQWHADPSVRDSRRSAINERTASHRAAAVNEARQYEVELREEMNQLKSLGV